MALHGLPNDIFSNLDPLALIILIPLFDMFFYPGLRRLGINFTPIKRITAGFFTGSAAMIWACVVQAYMYEIAFLTSLSPACRRLTRGYTATKSRHAAATHRVATARTWTSRCGRSPAATF